MRRAIAALAAVLIGAGLTGCGGGSSDSSSSTPDTDTVSTDTTLTTETTETAALEPGNVARGKDVFVKHCQECHVSMGTKRGVGPRLAGQGLTETFIHDTVKNGKPPLMPGGRAQGQDFEDVVAYVLSIQ